MARSALLVMLLTGCSVEPGIRIQVARQSVLAGLDLAGVEADVADAVAFWARCGYDIHFGGEPRMGGDRYVGFVAMEDGAPPGRSAPAGPELNRAMNWILDTEACEPGDDGNYVGEIVRHELGHQLGLGHEPEPQSIMYAYHLPCDQKYWSETCAR